MSVRKREWTNATGPQTRWITDYRDQSGTRRTKQFKRQKDAAAFEIKAKGEVAQGLHVADSETVTVAAAAALWLTSGKAADLEPTTIAQRRQHIERHIVPFIGPLKLNRLTSPAAHDFRDALRANGRSAAMVRKVMTSLSGIMKNAMRRGLATRNPVLDMERSTAGGRKRRLEIGVDIPSPSEIGQLVAALADMPRWRPVLLTAIFSGLRASELRGLRWTDIDLQNAVLHVRQRADTYNQIGRLKSKAGARTIPIGPLLVNTLREWQLACPRGPLGLAFPNSSGDVLTYWSLAEAGLQPAMRRAGLTDSEGRPKYPGLHSLRHWYASWSLNRRADGGRELPPKIVQERLGHSSITMTMDVYGHLFPVDDDGKLAADEARLWSTVTAKTQRDGE